MGYCCLKTGYTPFVLPISCLLGFLLDFTNVPPLQIKKISCSVISILVFCAVEIFMKHINLVPSET